MSTDHQTIPLAHIRTDGGTQTRARLNPDTIREYAEAMSRGEQLPDVTLYYDGTIYWMSDGFHRVAAARDLGRAEIGAEVRQGTQRDAILHSVAANATHGLPRSDEDKRRAVMRLLEDDEWSLWSDRKIAEATRTSHPFVGKIRKEVFGDDVPAERVVERDGQQYTMSTGGINDGREPSMLELAHEYTQQIPTMLADGGMLYTTIRNKLGVKQSSKMQMDALRYAMDTLLGQQKLIKKHGHYLNAPESEPVIFAIGDYVTFDDPREQYLSTRIGIVKGDAGDGKYAVQSWKTAGEDASVTEVAGILLRPAADHDYDAIWTYSIIRSRDDEAVLIRWKNHYLMIDPSPFNIRGDKYNFTYPNEQHPNDIGLATRISQEYVEHFERLGGIAHVFDLDDLDERMRAIAEKAGRARGGDLLYPPDLTGDEICAAILGTYSNPSINQSKLVMQICQQSGISDQFTVEYYVRHLVGECALAANWSNNSVPRYTLAEQVPATNSATRDCRPFTVQRLPFHEIVCTTPSGLTINVKPSAFSGQWSAYLKLPDGSQLTSLILPISYSRLDAVQKVIAYYYHGPFDIRRVFALQNGSEITVTYRPLKTDWFRFEAKIVTPEGITLKGYGSPRHVAISDLKQRLRDYIGFGRRESRSASNHPVSAPIDIIDPVTAEVTSVEQAHSVDDPDAKTRAWFRDQLRDGPRHYNILSRIARTEGVSMKAFLRVIRAMIDDGEVELDGRMYALAGDTQERPMLPDELADEDKVAIRDALINAVRDEALTSVQINNAIYAATGKKLDIFYLISWLDMLVRDEKLLKTAENGSMPRYRLNPNPPTDDEIQQRRQAVDVERRLDIVRQALANRQPHDEPISVTWLKRAAPGAAPTAVQAGDLLTLLVDLGELRIIDGTPYYEPVEVDGSAESTDPGQDGEAAVERAGEPRTRDEQPLAGDEADLTDEEQAILDSLRGVTEARLKALWNGEEARRTPAHDRLIARQFIRPVQKWSSGSPWLIGFVLMDTGDIRIHDKPSGDDVFYLLKPNTGVARRLRNVQIGLERITDLNLAEVALASSDLDFAGAIQQSLDTLHDIEVELHRLSAVAAAPLDYVQSEAVQA